MKYTEDKIFVELIRKLCKDILTEDDYSYIEDYEQFTELVKRWEKPIYQEGLEAGMEKGMEKGIDLGIEKERKKQQEKQYLEKLIIAKKCKAKGMSIDDIIDLTGLSKNEIEKLK